MTTISLPLTDPRLEHTAPALVIRTNENAVVFCEGPSLTDACRHEKAASALAFLIGVVGGSNPDDVARWLSLAVDS
jgi:hypothetical protein